MTNAHTILIGNPEEKNYSNMLERNIEMGLEGTGARVETQIGDRLLWTS
jgi:hypothetical protein